MRIAHKFDEEYRWVPGEEIYILFPNEEGIYEIPENYTFKELPEPNWKPKFNGEDWIETITDEELEAIKNPPVPKTEIELLQEKNKELENALLELTEISSFQEIRNGELEKALLEMTEIAADNSIKAAENENGILETTLLVGGITNV